MALQSAIPVQFEQVFPEGACAAGWVPAGKGLRRIERHRFVQSKDKASGLPLWVAEVIDADPQARSRTVKVKVAAQVQPVLPSGPAGHHLFRWSSPG